MSINSVTGANYTPYSVGVTKAAKETEAAETEKKSEKTVSAKTDTFEKSATYTVDADKISEMKVSLKNNIGAFEKMVNVLFAKQGIKYNESIGMKANMELLMRSGGVGEQERIAAQQAIGEDGEFGVEKTAQRILNFAIAVSGGDPAKAEMLRDAVKKGFAEAEKAWGGALPEICGKTYERVMQGFDEWEKQSAAKANA